MQVVQVDLRELLDVRSESDMAERWKPCTSNRRNRKRGSPNPLPKNFTLLGLRRGAGSTELVRGEDRERLPKHEDVIKTRMAPHRNPK